MEHWYVIWQLGKIKQGELLKQAEQFRKVQEAGRGRERAVPLYRVFLGRLGVKLISWGSYLCRRFHTPGQKDAFRGLANGA